MVTIQEPFLKETVNYHTYTNYRSYLVFFKCVCVMIFKMPFIKVKIDAKSLNLIHGKIISSSHFWRMLKFIALFLLLGPFYGSRISYCKII